ncbi:RNA-directed DNA polymerase, eukaryota, reverse transcriptase zinc-binding domain protein [Tanacetum coccineum]
MSHLSQNRNNSMGNDEYDDIRVVEDVTIVKIGENSSMMDKDGIKDGEMVDEDGGDVSDKNAHEEIKKLSMEKNKGVFGYAGKEFDDCNVVFGSMNRNDVVKEKELDQQRKADEKSNVSAMYDSAIKTDDVRNVNKLKNESFEKSYARTAEKIELNKNLFNIPTSKKENRDEVVVFYEEIVEEGSKKWVNNVCGYFIGCNMGPAELRYNIRRMWRMHRAEPDRIPVWVKPFNIPLEAWSVNGISALASRLGKPLVMDDMTASICHNGNGRSIFARVLVEIEVVKGFKDLIERQYKDKNNNVIRTNFLKVKFSWKPISYSHCNVFGHSDSRCYKNGTKKDQMENDKGTKVNHHNEGFVEVRHGRYGFMGLVQYKYVSKNDGSKKNMDPEMNKQMKDTQFKTPPQSPSKKSWNVGTKNIKELRRSANKYSILADGESNEEISKEFLERRLEVDRMSNQSDSETKDDLVSEENEAIKNLVADELDGVDTGRNVKFFCSFIYASNSGRERKDLWAILQDHKSIANNRPWILIGDDVSLCGGLEVGLIWRIQGIGYGVLEFLGLGTTFDIFKNIHVLYIENGVLSFSGYGVLNFIPLWSLVSAGTDTPYLP